MSNQKNKNTNQLKKLRMILKKALPDEAKEGWTGGEYKRSPKIDKNILKRAEIKKKGGGPAKEADVQKKRLHHVPRKESGYTGPSKDAADRESRPAQEQLQKKLKKIIEEEYAVLLHERAPVTSGTGKPNPKPRAPRKGGTVVYRDEKGNVTHEEPVTSRREGERKVKKVAQTKGGIKRSPHITPDPKGDLRITGKQSACPTNPSVPAGHADCKKVGAPPKTKKGKWTPEGCKVLRQALEDDIPYLGDRIQTLKAAPECYPKSNT